MLYWLLYEQLHTVVKAFNVFRYVTARAMFASLTSFFFCVLVGPWFIRKLQEFQIGQHIREDGPRSHQKKAGTPTMGGLLIVAGIVLPTLLWADLQHQYVWIAMFSLLAFGMIGFVDDYAKVAKKQNLGLSAKKKFGLQMIVAAIITVWLASMSGSGGYTTSLNIPFLKFHPDLLIHMFLDNPFTLPLAFLPFYLFFVFVVVGSSNAVNITDGLDGLAIGLMIISAGALTVFAYTTGNKEWAEHLLLARNPRTAELTIFCASMTGASLGFLWWNCHPAAVFMGDVGSLSLGGAMGVVAVLIKQEILLIFIAGMFVIELMSVILQVGSYKTRRKRIFRMAPIHHHFEALGWQESKIIARFWIIGLVLALFALTTLKLR